MKLPNTAAMMLLFGETAGAAVQREVPSALIYAPDGVGCSDVGVCEAYLDVFFLLAMCFIQDWGVIVSFIARFLSTDIAVAVVFIAI